MDKLQSYLNIQYKEDSRRIDDVLSLIEHVLPTFTDQFAPKGWPYQVGGKVNEKISPGTIAMTAGALQHVLNADVPESIFKACKNASFEKRDAVKTIVEKSRNLLDDEKQFGKESFEGESRPRYGSSTYGTDSVFVLSWVCALLQQVHLDALQSENDPVKRESRNAIHKRLVEFLAHDRIEKILLNINAPDELMYYDHDDTDYEKPEYDKSHAFPLLKTLQTYELYQFGSNASEEPAKTILKIAESFLLWKLHQCISLASLENSQFDAAEMVFSLEGYLIVRKLRLAKDETQLDAMTPFFCDDTILEKTFSILTEKQAINQYWRPLRPFLTKPQGYALLPISAEIAQSLLRICKRLGKRGNHLFAKHSGIFERYFDWIKSTVTTVNGLHGWCSEHIYHPDVIHIWQSSQVLLFLTDYYIFLRKKIASDALEAANLSVVPPKKPKSQKEFDEFWDTDPYKSKLVNKEIKRLIETSKNNKKAKESVSFLLYGPPGTGKTFFAEQISTLKQWPLLSLSPSDFIADGVDQLENKAKNLFTVLCAQHDLVIIFDEIDRLMLNRDSEDYKVQGDMFQVMVASLLVKFKALRDTPHIIFLICTNYKHRLDPALIRPGRVDKHILVMPPDNDRRIKQIKKHLEEVGKTFSDGLIERIATNTPLFTYTELNLLVDECDSNCNDDELRKLLKTHKPTISLSAYLQQTYSKNDKAGIQIFKPWVRREKERKTLRPMNELPLDEIFMTAYSLFETNHLKDEVEGNVTIREDLQRLVKATDYLNEALRKVGVAMGIQEEVKEMTDQISKDKYENDNVQKEGGTT